MECRSEYFQVKISVKMTHFRISQGERCGELHDCKTPPLLSSVLSPRGNPPSRIPNPVYSSRIDKQRGTDHARGQREILLHLHVIESSAYLPELHAQPSCADPNYN